VRGQDNGVCGWVGRWVVGSVAGGGGGGGRCMGVGSWVVADEGVVASTLTLCGTDV